MKRILALVLLAALLLSGCSAAEGNPEWDESWIPLGEAAAIEPMEGFSLYETNDTLSPYGLYYATWACGEERDYVNQEGENAKIFDAQIYVLLEQCGDGEEAAREVESWIDREKQTYTCGEEKNETFAGQEFRLLPLLSGKEGNPYSFGIGAFARRGECAVSVELVCSERFAEDPEAVLARFLNGFHYSED